MNAPSLLAALENLSDSKAAEFVLQKLLRFAKMLARHNAEDLAQDCFFKLWRNAKQGTLRLEANTEEEALAYLKKVVRNASIDEHRKAVGSSGTAVVAAEEVAQVAVAAPVEEPFDILLMQSLNRFVVEKQPALERVFEQVRALREGTASSLAVFISEDLAPEEATRRRESLQQQHCRWRKHMLSEARARFENQKISADDLRDVESRISKLRQRGEKKPRKKRNAPGTG